MVLYCFQEFLLLTLALPGSIAVCLKAEIKEESCNRITPKAEGCSMEGRCFSSSGGARAGASGMTCSTLWWSLALARSLLPVRAVGRRWFSQSRREHPPICKQLTSLSSGVAGKWRYLEPTVSLRRCLMAAQVLQNHLPHIQIFQGISSMSCSFCPWEDHQQTLNSHPCLHIPTFNCMPGCPVLLWASARSQTEPGLNASYVSHTYTSFFFFLALVSLSNSRENVKEQRWHLQLYFWISSLRLQPLIILVIKAKVFL